MNDAQRAAIVPFCMMLSTTAAFMGVALVWPGCAAMAAFPLGGAFGWAACRFSIAVA